jgi:uroporphyrinogen-III synthase
MFLYRYKTGMSEQESELVRQLRRRGFAIVVMNPVEVGEPINRKPLEDRMLAAGRRALRRIKA